MEFIQLVEGHQLEQLLDRGPGLEVAGDIEMETTVAETGRVLDAGHRHLEGCLRLPVRRDRQQGPQALNAIKNSRRIRADDFDPVAGGQTVGFVPASSPRTTDDDVPRFQNHCSSGGLAALGDRWLGREHRFERLGEVTGLAFKTGGIANLP